MVGAAAIYNHLLTKHGGVGTRPKSKTVGDGATSNGEKANTGGDDTAGTDVAAAKPAKVAACDCGGAMGSCKVQLMEFAGTFVKGRSTTFRFSCAGQYTFGFDQIW